MHHAYFSLPDLSVWSGTGLAAAFSLLLSTVAMGYCCFFYYLHIRNKNNLFTHICTQQNTALSFLFSGLFGLTVPTALLFIFTTKCCERHHCCRTFCSWYWSVETVLWPGFCWSSSRPIYCFIRARFNDIRVDEVTVMIWPHSHRMADRITLISFFIKSLITSLIQPEKQHLLLLASPKLYSLIYAENPW